MDERLRFVGRLLDGEKMAALRREFEVSRKPTSMTLRALTPDQRAMPASNRLETLVAGTSVRAIRVQSRADPSGSAEARDRLGSIQGTSRIADEPGEKAARVTRRGLGSV